MQALREGARPPNPQPDTVCFMPKACTPLSANGGIPSCSSSCPTTALFLITQETPRARLEFCTHQVWQALQDLLACQNWRCGLHDEQGALVRMAHVNAGQCWSARGSAAAPSSAALSGTRGCWGIVACTTDRERGRSMGRPPASSMATGSKLSSPYASWTIPPAEFRT